MYTENKFVAYIKLSYQFLWNFTLKVTFKTKIDVTKVRKKKKNTFDSKTGDITLDSKYVMDKVKLAPN